MKTTSERVLEQLEAAKMENELNIRETVAIANIFIRDNLKECATELLEWTDTAKLRDGKVRKLEKILEPTASSYALTVAKGMIELACVEEVANGK